MVYISFLISHVPPAHSFFHKKSILTNLTQNLVQLIFQRLLKENDNRMDESFSTYSLIVGTPWPFAVSVFCKVPEQDPLMRLDLMAVYGGSGRRAV